ncbi:GNAT family N-acetyltransferase [Lutimonas zeaxanthinifaciens]|uniref:GNAT family N-acetyltransferase n=1 Tax=Lutimonas zeaxanthinifaciens TaxID=3060215 RepID=UPI00265CA6C2|nr:GNAT family N-acetyltransferase [Lutimonas sp. YSD2104]WKK66203.1 GNAT family N-acetyltransferase [Lutimonas sp. YSD2104]
MEIIKTSSKNKDFQLLVAQLDDELAERDGPDHDFYHQFNGIENLDHVILVKTDEHAIACGAIKAFGQDTMEVKRMFVKKEFRSRGIAKLTLGALEAWALELGIKKCILETGKRQPEAIALYRKAGYNTIPNYGQYRDVENSVCMEKSLKL